MSIQNPTPGLLAALKAAETGRLTSIKKTVQMVATPFEELAQLRPPSLNVPTTPGIQRLRAAFGLGIAQPGPATRGLFELVVKGALSPAMIDYVVGHQQGIADLRREAAQLRSQLETFPTPAWAISHAALDMVAHARTFGDLTDTPLNRAVAAGFIAERLAGHIAPFAPGLRPAIREALLTGALTQPTLNALGARGARQLAAALKPHLGLIALMPGTHTPALRQALGAVVKTLGRHPSQRADQLADAVRAQLRGRMLERFNDVQARANALVAQGNGQVNAVGGIAGPMGNQVPGAIGGPDRRTVTGGFSAQAQGQVQGSGRFETTLGTPGQGPGRAERMIGKAFDAIPDLDKSFDVQGGFGGTASAHTAGAASGALGSASYEANVSAYARGEGYARGGIKKDGESLEAYGQAGFKLEAGVAADANFKANLFGGLVQADGQVSGVVRAEAHADASAAVTVGRDAQGRIQLHAQAALDVGASVEATARGKANLNLGGMQVAAEGQAGVLVGFRANANAEFGLKDGKVSMGFGFKLAFIVGLNLNFRLSFPVPKFITNFGQAIGQAKDAVVNGVKAVASTVSAGVQAVGSAIGNAAKAVGNFFSGL